MTKISRIFLSVAALFVCTTLFAQEDPSKEIVIINPFAKSAVGNQAMSDNLRTSVMAGLSARGRFHMVDALTDPSVSQLYANRTFEDTVNDSNWKSESEGVFKQMGATKLIDGQLNNVSFSTSTEGSTTYYKSDVTFALRIYNIVDGALLASENLAVSGLSSVSRDAALDEAMKEVRRAMTKFVDDNFKFDTTIVELGDADKKGKLKEVYILGGSEMGVAKKTRFKVFIEQQIGPKMVRREVGVIVAEEVMDGMTKCSIASGDDVIKEKFNSGDKLIVVVDKQNTAAGAALRGLNPFKK